MNHSAEIPLPYPYRVYRDDRYGHFARSYAADTLTEGVQAFLRTAPVDGRRIILWDCSAYAHRKLASVEWHNESTSFGFAVRTRTNVFHDEATAAIARQITERETLEKEIRQSTHMTA